MKLFWTQIWLWPACCQALRRECDPPKIAWYLVTHSRIVPRLTGPRKAPLLSFSQVHRSKSGALDWQEGTAGVTQGRRDDHGETPPQLQICPSNCASHKLSSHTKSRGLKETDGQWQGEMTQQTPREEAIHSKSIYLSPTIRHVSSMCWNRAETKQKKSLGTESVAWWWTYRTKGRLCVQSWAMQ